MRSKFRGYYRPSESEFQELWRDAFFSMDASILLNTYRYSAETQGTFFAILQKLNPRIWITYQAALEYQENRLGVVETQQTKVYEELKKKLGALSEQLATASPRHHPYLDAKAIMLGIGGNRGHY